MTTTLKAICGDIDETLAEFFVVAQELMDCQHEMNYLLKDGNFLLAKARYSMGVKSVSELQYDEKQMELGARLTVLVDGDEFFLKNNLANTAKATNSSDQPTVIRRNVKKDTTSDNDDIATGIEELTMSTSKKTVDTPPYECQSDPIKWFGVLVPQSLRQSQAKFKRASELACKIASLKVKYCKLQSTFHELKEEKAHLLNDSISFNE